MATEHKHLFKAIDEILWNNWDPIGINDSAPRDEYYGYVPIIFDLKLKNATQESIAQKLFELETKNMGLNGNIDHCRIIAGKIISLK